MSDSLPKGFRVTKQRIKIIEILEGKSIPLTAEEIFEEAKKEFPNIALTTVYRNLEALSDAGVVIRTVFHDGTARFKYGDEVGRHKHLLICKNCKKTVVIDECPLIQMENEIQNETGFKITDHNLEIYGYCKDCSEKN